MSQILTCCGEIRGGGAGQLANCLGGSVRGMSHSSSSRCTTPDTGFNRSHWKKARGLIPKCRPIFHFLAIVGFLYYPFPPESRSQAIRGPLQMDRVSPNVMLCSEASIPGLYFIAAP